MQREPPREAELRKMLIEAHDGLFRRDEEYQAALTAASQNEALQRELAAFRRFAVGTLEVCLATPEGDRLEAFAIDSPTSASQVTAEEIVVERLGCGSAIRRCGRGVARAYRYPQAGAGADRATGHSRRASSSTLGRNQRLPDYD